jgi:hypothetical protein
VRVDLPGLEGRTTPPTEPPSAPDASPTDPGVVARRTHGGRDSPVPVPATTVSGTPPDRRSLDRRNARADEPSRRDRTEGPGRRPAGSGGDEDGRGVVVAGPAGRTRVHSGSRRGRSWGAIVASNRTASPAYRTAVTSLPVDGGHGAFRPSAAAGSAVTSSPVDGGANGTGPRSAVAGQFIVRSPTSNRQVRAYTGSATDASGRDRTDTEPSVDSLDPHDS